MLNNKSFFLFKHNNIFKKNSINILKKFLFYQNFLVSSLSILLEPSTSILLNISKTFYLSFFDNPFNKN